jgi:hypothetical protein
MKLLQMRKDMEMKKSRPRVTITQNKEPNFKLMAKAIFNIYHQRKQLSVKND